MTRHTIRAEPRRPSSREAQKTILRNLLVDGYREREGLLRDRYGPVADDNTSGRTTSSNNSALIRPANNVWAGNERTRGGTHLAAVEAPMHAADAPSLQVDVQPQERPSPLRIADHVASKIKLIAPDRNHAASPRKSDGNEQTGRTALFALDPSIGRNAIDVSVRASRAAIGFLLPPPEKGSGHDAVLNDLWRRGLRLIVIFVGALGLWMVATSISSAVVGSGQFVVDGSSKKVQHPTGGVVSQIFVREGDQVSAGDLLIRLDETVTRSNFQVIAGQLDELTGRKARLEAERDGKDKIDVPGDLSSRRADPEVARIVAAEDKLFDARRSARESQRAQLSKRISQLQDETAGLRAQLDANARETQIIGEELKGVRDLYARQLTPIMRLSALERQAVNLTGQRGQFTASIAQIQGKIAEIELQITQIDDNLRSETQKELREVQGKIAELSERRIAAFDVHKRIEIRAPSSGTVHQLNVHTVGGVVSPAEPIMVIVPSNEELVVEAKVLPQDRDQLQLGQKVTVRVRSANQRSTPELNGTLTRVSADVSKDASTSMPFYTVWVTVPKEELSRLSSSGISVGMQTDVFIETGSRSPLSYLLRPLTDQAQRAFKER